MIPFELSTEESALVRGGFFRRSRENKGKTNMKQLKFMLAAATAVGIAAAAKSAPVNENFNGYTTDMKGAAITNVVYDSNNQTLISGIPGFSFEGAEGDNESAIVADGENDMALNVNMGTDPLLCQLDIGSRVDLTEENLQSLNIDTMVQFTVTPENDTVMPGLVDPDKDEDEDGNVDLVGNIKEDKLLIYLQEKTVGETKSNVLTVWASEVQSGGDDDFGAGEDKFLPTKVEIPGVEVVPNKWYRLQVKTYVENGIVLFSIKLGDTELASSVALYSSATQGTKAFPSLLGKATTLTYVGFAGEGKVDDLVVTKSYLATSVDFTLALGEGVSSVKFTIGEDSYTLDAETTEMTIDDLALNSKAVITEVKYADYYIPADGDLVKDSEIALNAATVSKVVKASTKLNKVEGEVTPETAKTEYGVAENAQIFTSTSDNATEAGAEITSAQIAKILDWNNRVNGGKIADVNSMKFVAGEPDGNSAEAFLLNCSTAELAKEKEEFKFSPEDLASLMTSGLSATGLDADKQKYIGEFVLEGASALNGEATVWKDSTKWTDEKNPDFYRARLIFK